MANIPVVADSCPSMGQFKDFFRQFDDGSLNSYHLALLLDHRNPFRVSYGKILMMVDFYKKFFDMEINPKSFFDIPAEPDEGFDFLLLIPKGLTYDQLASAMKRHGLLCSRDYGFLLNRIDPDQEVRNTRKNYGIYLDGILMSDELSLHTQETMEDFPHVLPDRLTLLEATLFVIYKSLWCSMLTSYPKCCLGSRTTNGEIPYVTKKRDLVCLIFYSSDIETEVRVREQKVLA